MDEDGLIIVIAAVNLRGLPVPRVHRALLKSDAAGVGLKRGLAVDALALDISASDAVALHSKAAEACPADNLTELATRASTAGAGAADASPAGVCAADRPWADPSAGAFALETSDARAVQTASTNSAPSKRVRSKAAGAVALAANLAKPSSTVPEEVLSQLELKTNAGPQVGDAENSRYVGVCKHKRSGRWQASVRNKYLGLFATQELAAFARWCALHGTQADGSKAAPASVEEDSTQTRVQRVACHPSTAATLEPPRLRTHPRPCVSTVVAPSAVLPAAAAKAPSAAGLSSAARELSMTTALEPGHAVTVALPAARRDALLALDQFVLGASGGSGQASVPAKLSTVADTPEPTGAGSPQTRAVGDLANGHEAPRAASQVNVATARAGTTAGHCAASREPDDLLLEPCGESERSPPPQLLPKRSGCGSSDSFLDALDSLGSLAFNRPWSASHSPQCNDSVETTAATY